jgi:hypothetical protein
VREKGGISFSEVLVCIGTLEGRERYYDEVATAWRDCSWSRLSVQVATVRGSSLGMAWNACVRLTEKYPWDYIMFTADDQAPWDYTLDAAISWLDKHPYDVAGFRLHQYGLPLDPNYDALAHGETTPWARGWLMRPHIYAQVGPFLDLSWYLDIEYSQRLAGAGYSIRMLRGFGGDHLDAPRTWLTDTERQRQYQAYHDACAAAGRSPFV